ADTDVFHDDANHAGVSERVAAVAALYAPARLDALTRGMLSLSPIEALPASPLEYVSPAFPPTIFLHGAADRAILPSLPVQMYEALSAVGVLTDLHLYGRLPHAFVQLPGCTEGAMAEVASFFERAVVNRAGFDAALAE